MSNHSTSTDIEHQSGDNRDRLRDDDTPTTTTTTTPITNTTKKSLNQVDTIYQLFRACINSDIATMENIIKSFETNRESFINDKLVGRQGSTFNEHSYLFGGKFNYNRPLIEQTCYIDHISNEVPLFEDFTIANSLLDAASLSNSPTIIDFVFKVCKITGYCHISFWKGKSDGSLGIGQSALLLALAAGKLNSFQHLIDEYCAQFDDNGMMFYILGYFLHPHRLQQLKLLVQHSPDALSSLVNPEDNCYYLRRVIKYRNDELIQYIVDLGVSIDTPDGKGHSALYTYAHKFKWDMVQYLIGRFNANWDLRCSFDCDSEKCYKSLLAVALSDPNLTIEVFDFIINHIGVEASIDDSGDETEDQTPLLFVAERGKLSLVKHLINHHHANINATCSLNRALLHYAVKSNNLDLIQYIVDDPMFHFDINVLDGDFGLDGDSYTPLSMNVNRISLDVVKFMVAHKSDITSDIRIMEYELHEDDDDDLQLAQINILPLAAKNPDSNVIEYLIEQIGITQLTQHELDQCLFQSIKSQQLHTAQILIEKYNANRNYEFPKNCNIFHFTLKFNNSGSYIRDFIHFLQPTKEELEATSSDHQTPLFIAAKSHCDIECIKTLVEFGANIHFINKISNENVLHAILSDEYHFHLDSSNHFLLDPERIADQAAIQTAIDSCVKVLQYCIDSNVDVNAKCQANGQTPLHYAAKLSNVDITQVLLKNGANIDEIDVDGNTPLCIAAKSNRLFPLKTLIEHGANINIQNKKGQTAIHLAACHFRSDLIPTLSTPNCNINIKDENGNTPLLLVPLSSTIRYRSKPSFTMHQLLSHKSDPTIINNNGQTILHLMASTKQLDLRDVGILTSVVDAIIECSIEKPNKTTN